MAHPIIMHFLLLLYLNTTAASALVESQIAIESGGMSKSISPQQLVDCDVLNSGW